jgi:hypothetical protein
MRLFGSNTSTTLGHSNRLGPKVEPPVGRLGKTQKFFRKIVKGYDKAKQWIKKGIGFAQQNPHLIYQYAGKHAETIHNVVNMADKATKVIEDVTGH